MDIQTDRRKNIVKERQRKGETEIRRDREMHIETDRRMDGKTELQ
jgi:hypothetical protein